MSKRKSLPRPEVDIGGWWQVEDGEPYYLKLPHDSEQCCDCGLVHVNRYRVEDRNGKVLKGARIRVTTWRHNRSTAAIRRGFNFSKED